MSMFLVPLVAMVVVILGLTVMLKRLLYVVTPNQVLVRSGSRRRVGNRTVGYRAIRGGRAIRIPLLERVDVVDLSNIPLFLDGVEVRTDGEMRLKLAVVAHVRPAGLEPLLGRWLEYFLGRSREQIAAVAQQVLTGVVAEVSGSLAPDEIVLDTERFEQTLTAEVEMALNGLGLELDALRVKEVTDAYGYADAIRSQ